MYEMYKSFEVHHNAKLTSV